MKAESRDLLLPFAVVAVVGMMIFPLPPQLLDALLVCNISFALVLLVSSVYLSESESFTSLPTILLLSTLFRLGLNVSTTRQLLSTGEAPELVRAFGEFVVSGNLVVGVVVFCIVTLVQFLVVAKGAERVAEVAARFTLDALPGKQMSIDADIRSGILSVVEARERRAELHRESKLFGALDGAMKFVKGDAIAGICITLVNITAGFFVGIFQQNLGVGVALERYTLFTVGDGLVNQIPALLVSVAAGIAVTRVSESDGSFIGRDVLNQLSKVPQALGTTACVLLALAIVPGFPTFALIVLGLLFAVSAKRGHVAMALSEEKAELVRFHPKSCAVLTLVLSPGSATKLKSAKSFLKSIQVLKQSFFHSTGVVVPDAVFDIQGGQIEDTAEVFLRGVPVATLHFAKLSGLPLDGKDSSSEDYSSRFCDALEEFLRERLEEFIDDIQTQQLLDTHRTGAERLIAHVIPDILSITAFTGLLRALVRERVSIRDLPSILQAIAEFSLDGQRGKLHSSDRAWSGSSKSLPPTNIQTLFRSGSEPREMLAEVRIALGRAISRSISDAEWRVSAYLLSPEIDGVFAQAAFAGNPLRPGFLDEVLECMKEGFFDSEQRYVLITTKYARGVVASYLHTELNNVRVIAGEELSNEVQLEVAGRISLQTDSFQSIFQDKEEVRDAA